MPCAAMVVAVGDPDTGPSSSDVDEAPLCIISGAGPTLGGLKCRWLYGCVPILEMYPCVCECGAGGCCIAGWPESLAIDTLFVGAGGL